MEDIELITFNCISKFVGELSDLYGKKQKSLAYYKRLLDKTTISNVEPIKKHIKAFKTFCVDNRDIIHSKDSEKIKESSSNIIMYSNLVCIDMGHIFRLISKEETTEEINDITEAVWKHILTISAMIDPAGKAKEILKKNNKNSEKKDEGNEFDFISGIIDKVEKNVDPNSNPMEAVTSIMQSGVFTDMIGDMSKNLQEGNLDLGKLMGTVTGLVSNMGDSQGGQGTEVPDLGNMMSNLMGGLSQGGQGSIDMNKMMEQMQQGFENTKIEGSGLEIEGGKESLSDVSQSDVSQSDLQEKARLASDQKNMIEGGKDKDINNVE